MAGLAGFPWVNVLGRSYSTSVWSMLDCRTWTSAPVGNKPLCSHLCTLTNRGRNWKQLESHKQAEMPAWLARIPLANPPSLVCSWDFFYFVSVFKHTVWNSLPETFFWYILTQFKKCKAFLPDFYKCGTCPLCLERITICWDEWSL